MTLTWLEKGIVTIGENTITYGDVLFVALAACVYMVFSWLLKVSVERLARGRTDSEQANIHIISRLVYYISLVIGVLLVLSILGIDVTKVALLASALSVGIGFGLQSIFNNFISGIILLFERSLKVGDVVELADGTIGVVKEINIRSTRINTADNMDVIVPNSEFVSSRVNNWTLSDRYRRIRIPFGVHYRTDKELVKQAAIEAANRVSATVSPPGKEPNVWLVNFGDNSLDFQLVVWVSPQAIARPGTLKAMYLWEIETSLKQYNIEIPYPQRDIHIISDSAADGSDIANDVDKLLP